MNLFGLTIQRSKAVAEIETKALSSVGDRGWWPVVHEAFTGAWQRNIRVDNAMAESFYAVYSCRSLIANAISVLRLKLVEKVTDEIWTETSSPAFSPVLIKPNHYQTRIQFLQQWIISKLRSGNTYVIKERDNRNIVIALYILNPDRCRPMEADDGSVWYELRPDKLAGLRGDNPVMVPAREIIHDRMNAGMFHQLCGVSPIYAAGLAATHGLAIQSNSAQFFFNNSQPSGILTTEGRITEADAKLMKEQWEQNYSGKNLGRVAVFGGGLKFVPLAMTAADAQLIEQQKMSAGIVAAVHHVPEYMLNLGAQPLNNNVQALWTQWYQLCLQEFIESIELCMDEGLGIGDGTVIAGRTLGVEADIANLQRMDALAQAEFVAKLVTASVFSPDDARAVFSKTPTPGGASPMAQHQMYSLQDLAVRSSMPNPFHPELDPSSTPSPPPQPDPPPAAKGLDNNVSERRPRISAASILRSADRHGRRRAA